MDEFGMALVWLVIILATAVAGILTDSPTLAIIVGILTFGLSGVLIIRRQPR